MSRAAANRNLVIRLVVIVLGMFGFGFALVPLYDVFCQLSCQVRFTQPRGAAKHHVAVFKNLIHKILSSNLQRKHIKFEQARA